MIQLAAFWVKKNKSNETYMTGNLNNARLVVLPNKFKKAEGHPDYILFIAESRPKTEEPEKK